MAERLVVNTGPLIALRRAEALDVVGRLPVEFLSPREVRDELLEGARHGQLARSFAGATEAYGLGPWNM